MSAAGSSVIRSLRPRKSRKSTRRSGPTAAAMSGASTRSSSSPEGEHSAQSGALGAALTGGKYISNASSSQGILYGLESHYVTVGKKVGGFVLQVAARVVSKHSLNVMAGHDDVYALLPPATPSCSAPTRRKPPISPRSPTSVSAAVADSGRQRHGRLRHQPHAVRGLDARAGTAARNSSAIRPAASRRRRWRRRCCSAPRAACSS